MLSSPLLNKGPLFGLFIISASLMVSQILLLRLSRAAFIFDIQFIILSSAILGLGLGSLVVFLLFNSGNIKKLGKLSVLTCSFFCIFCLMPFFILHLVNFYPFWLVATLFFISQLLLYISAGILIALAFRYYSQSKSVHLVYFVNMAGSALGAFLAIFLLDKIGLQAIVANFIVALLALTIYSAAYGFKKIIILISAIAFLFFFFSSNLITNFQVICEPNKKLLNSLVNSFSQVDVYASDSQEMTRGDELGINPHNLPEPPLYEINFECSHIMYIFDYGLLKEMQFLNYYLSSFVYQIRNYSNVLVLGSGTGNEIIEAVINNAKKVVGVEINPLVIKVVQAVNPDNVYNDKRVKLVLGEGRNFVLQTKDKFDLIYIPTSKKFGGIGAQSFALSENYLYTKEAFGIYLKHLTDDGIIAVLDWNPFTPQFLSTLKSALIEEHKNPNDLVLVKGNRMAGIFYKNKGFTDREIKNIQNKAYLLGFEVFFGQSINLPKAPIITNDKPYIGNYHLGLINLLDNQNVKISQAYVYFLFLLALLYSVFMIIVYTIRPITTTRTKFLPLLFTFLGLGFIMAELFLIEKVTLILGHPVYSVALVLSLLLMFGGLGGLMSRRLATKAVIIEAALTVIVLTLYLNLDYLVNVLSPIDFPLKMLFSVIILSLPSFLMGMLFSACLKLTESYGEKLLPLALTIDGFASFLGGVLFKVVALFWGLSFGFTLSIICYGIVMLTLLSLSVFRPRI